MFDMQKTNALTNYKPVSRFWFPYDSRSLLNRHISSRFEAALAAGRAERAAIQTPEALRERQDAVRRHFCESLGIQPDQYPQPIAAETVRTTAYEGYSVENIMLTPEAGIRITANLYIPDTKAPHAAVLFLCGHAAEGKLYSEYMKVCETLVGAGLAVFAMDPTGQGERWNYYDLKTKQPTIRPTVPDHDRAGCRGLATGRSMAYYFVRDAQVALSYLCARPDIDAARIGVTGNSGGGTQTAMVMLADRRPAAFAPGTFVMSLGAMQRSGQAQDSEQIWPGFAANGCDHADILLACAPKPVLVLAAEYDFFPKEGTDETVAEAKRYWELCGRSEAFGCFTDRCFHCYSDPMKQAAARFFAKWLLGETSAIKTVEHADPARCLCTKSGQTSADFPDFKRAAQLYSDYAQTIRQPSGGEAWLKQVVFSHRHPAPAMNLRPLESTQTLSSVRAIRWMWQSQADLYNCGMLLTPADAAEKRPVSIGIWDGGTQAIAEHGGWIDTQLAEGRSVFVVDLAGEGQLEPYPAAPEASLRGHYGTLYKLSSDLLMLGDSLPALRIYDLVTALDAAEHLPVYDGSGLRVYACGRSTVYARLAQKIDPRMQALTCEGGIENYRTFLDEEPYDDTDILSHTLPGMLTYFD